MFRFIVGVCVLFCGVAASAASELVFDRAAGTLELKSKCGKSVGSWEAANNLDKKAKGPFPDGEWPFGYRKTHAKDAPNSAYGSYGIIVFKVPRRPGLGVHSGRATWKTKPGPQHPTMGCIRTTDAAMKKILLFNTKDALTKITVK